MKIKKTATTLTAVLGLALCTSAHAATLFADTFDRANGDDLNASTTGKSGSLGALDWLETSGPTSGTLGAGGSIVSNQLQLGEEGAGGGWALAYLDHNFIDTSITTNRNFSVSVDIVNSDTGGATRYAGIVVGGPASRYSGWSSNNPATENVDFYIGYDGSGTEQFRIWENGVLTTTTNLSFVEPDTLRVDFTNVTNFTLGTTINYEVFNNGSSVATGDFTWSGTNQNYLGLFTNWTAGGAELDNFSVTTVPEPGTTALVGLCGLALILRRRK
ncbi:PEP-CTERM sorting domain-containing protein [Akkermansiaceae bacterium]|nr:PEP-CTERM sorting domain-containing protein [Akkermansiaceae bacterium]